MGARFLIFDTYHPTLILSVPFESQFMGRFSAVGVRTLEGVVIREALGSSLLRWGHSLAENHRFPDWDLGASKTSGLFYQFDIDIMRGKMPHVRCVVVLRGEESQRGVAEDASSMGCGGAASV